MKMNMDIPYEKMPISENSSAVFIDGPVQVQEAPVRVRHYFTFSLFSALCLCPATGLIALAYSLKSSAKADVKFHNKALLYSRRALLWNLVSLVFAVLSFIMVIAFCYYFNQFVAANAYRMDDNFPRRSDNSDYRNEVNNMIQSLTNN